MELSTEEAQSRVSLLGTHTRSLSRFLEEFSSPLQDTEYKPFGDKKYKNQLQEIKNGSSRVLKVYMNDVRQYFLKENNDRDLYEGLMLNTYRYLELFYIASELVLDTLEKDEQQKNYGMFYDPIDELRESRMKQNKLPINLRSNYDILLVNGYEDYIMKMKYVNADFVGCLVLIEVDVLRVTNISPRLKIATYECDICHNHSYKTVDGNTYMPLLDCMNCMSSKNVKSTLKFHPKLSKFEKYQEIRVQEPLVHLNEGEIPKNLKCQLTNSLVGLLRPGDIVLLYGVLLPMFKEGFANNKFTLLSDKIFKILNIQHIKKFKLLKQVDYNVQIEDFSKDVNIYEKLANSIAPEIYGHLDIKKALLLQLIGGCNVVKNDGGFIRGNIHVLLIGDPGVAKSQLMKRICMISNHGIYTTGKGSSSSGLTASIIKDVNTGDFVLEGGALVLANNGICCIDEFDKMDEEDRSAIYEVMEQQKVSIAKSGHITTLKANSSVLAAANPLNGVYDIKKSVMVNINMPAALLSRFDLQFILLDNIHQLNDYRLSQYKLSILSNSVDGVDNAATTAREKGKKKSRAGGTNAATGSEQQDTQNIYNNSINTGTQGTNNLFSADFIRYYINYAKQFKPVCNKFILDKLCKWYISNRQEELRNELYQDNQYIYITPRIILSILRLSQALARLRFRNLINLNDLEEAIRLVECMKNTVSNELKKQRDKRKVSTSSSIMLILKKMRNNLKANDGWDGWVNIYDLHQQILSNGFKTKDLNDFLNKYSQLSIILLNNNNTQLSFPEDVR